jgi:hypothetical protein
MTLSNRTGSARAARHPSGPSRLHAQARRAVQHRGTACSAIPSAVRSCASETHAGGALGAPCPTLRRSGLRRSRAQPDARKNNRCRERNPGYSSHKATAAVWCTPACKRAAVSCSSNCRVRCRWGSRHQSSGRRPRRRSDNSSLAYRSSPGMRSSSATISGELELREWVRPAAPGVRGLRALAAGLRALMKKVSLVDYWNRRHMGSSKPPPLASRGAVACGPMLLVFLDPRRRAFRQYQRADRSGGRDSDVPFPELGRHRMEGRPAACANYVDGMPPWRSSPLVHMLRLFRWALLRAPCEVPLPGEGCFVAHYPDKTWHPIQCKPARSVPNPLRRPVEPFNVGNGTDYFATVTGNTITSATGSFDSVSGVTDVFSAIYNNPTTIVFYNTYTLQLNANTFSTSLCKGALGCFGWEQFIFSQRSGCGSPCIYIEYWVYNFNAPCSTLPSVPGANWQTFSGSNNASAGCFLNTPGTPLPAQPIADLGKVKLTGTVSSGGDTVQFATANGDVYGMGQNLPEFGLAQAWSGAEFNIFGDCCGYEAYLNSNSKLAVRLAVNNGTTNAPNCVSSFPFVTVETNNLDLLSDSCSPVTNPSPAITYTESGGGDLPNGVFVPGGRIGGGEASAASNCPSGTEVTGIYYWNGDTVSPAPTWVPNHQLHCQDASGNTSLGNRIGGGEPAGYPTCPAGSFVIGINYWNGDSLKRITALPNHQLVCQDPSTNVKSFSTIEGGGEWVTNLSCPPGTYLIGIQFWNGDTVSPAPIFTWPWGYAYVPNHELECRPYPGTGQPGLGAPK